MFDWIKCGITAAFRNVDKGSVKFLPVVPLFSGNGRDLQQVIQIKNPVE